MNAWRQVHPSALSFDIIGVILHCILQGKRHWVFNQNERLSKIEELHCINMAV